MYYLTDIAGENAFCLTAEGEEFWQDINATDRTAVCRTGQQKDGPGIRSLPTAHR